MLRPVFALTLLAALILSAGGSFAAAIQDPNMVVLPDPDLSKAARFPAGAATQGQAHISPALDKADVRSGGCSALNPCALAEPDHDAMAMPPQPRESERHRARQPS
jgi:hypothetical protein